MADCGPWGQMLSIAVSVLFFNTAPKLRHTIFLSNGIKTKCDIGGSGDGEGGREKKNGRETLMWLRKPKVLSDNPGSTFNTI